MDNKKTKVPIPKTVSITAQRASTSIQTKDIKVRKIPKDLPEPMRNYIPALDIYEDCEHNKVTWVECIPLSQVKVPPCDFFSPTYSTDGTFSGYVDTNGEPFAGYFVW